MIEDIDDVGAVDTNPAFKHAVQFTVRTAFYAMLLGCTVWVPIVRKLFPDTLAGYMGLATLLYFFTVNKILGTTIQSGIGKIWATFLAAFHMWVLQGFFPGGVSHTTPAYITYVGWANFLGFLWLVYWSKCGLGTKMCAVAYDIGFMTDFINPDSAATYSTNFKIKASGIAVNCMIATSLASVAAIFPNLVPYPMTTAFASMKASGLKIAADMS